MIFTVQIGSGRDQFPPILDFRTDPRTAWAPSKTIKEAANK